MKQTKEPPTPTFQEGASLVSTRQERGEGVRAVRRRDNELMVR